MVAAVSSHPMFPGDSCLAWNDFVGSFPGWANLPLGWVLSSRCNFVQDEISYVKSSELHSLVVVLGHLLQVLRHLMGCFVSRFVKAIQVDI